MTVPCNRTQGRWIGTDEAGLGPNLGPLVVSATAWHLPVVPEEIDLYDVLAGAIDRDSTQGGTRLWVADSKRVYNPGRGLGTLETSALALLGQMGPIPKTWEALSHQLTGRPLSATAGEPWLRDRALDLPLVADRDHVQRMTDRLRRTCEMAGIQVAALRSDLVETPRFNTECDQTNSKGVVLSRTTLRLLEEVWPDDGVTTLAICDKHGGRNQYAPLLSEAFGELFIPRLEESAERSCYTLRSGEVRFQVRAEEYLPTAAASILSKYLRELSMELLNQFWQSHQPGLKSTKGYPEDARRFRADIAVTQAALGISDQMLWRRR